MAEPSGTPHAGALRRNLLRIALIALLAWGLHLLLGWATEQAEMDKVGPRFAMLAGFLLVYALLIAIPFVPGVEIGLTLMAMEGPWIAPWIYLATVAGLTSAFFVGETLPYARLHRLLADLRLHGACRMIERIQPLDRTARLRGLQDRVPRWLRPTASRYRYLLPAVLINLPGNSIIGGGGGVMFMAGFSRLFHPLPMLATIAVAVAPVPVAMWGFGVDLRWLFGQ